MTTAKIPTFETANELRGFPIPLWTEQLLSRDKREARLNLVRCNDCGVSNTVDGCRLWPVDYDRPAASPAVLVCHYCNKKRIAESHVNTFQPVMKLAWARAAERDAAQADHKRAVAVAELVESLGGNQSEAARRLKLHPSTVNKLVKRAQAGSTADQSDS